MQDLLLMCIESVVAYKLHSKGGSYSYYDEDHRYRDMLMTYNVKSLSDMTRLSEETIGRIFLNPDDRELIEHLRFTCGKPEFEGFIKKIIKMDYTMSQTIDDIITGIYHFSDGIPKKKTFSTKAPPTHEDLRVLLKTLQTS